MKTIVITSDKGGVGKSTLAALIIEWLNFNNKKVDLIDVDPIQTTRTWSDNCESDNRNVLSKNPDYLIVDTAGTSGAGLTWLQKADIIIAPFQPHYADIKTVVDWFYLINKNLQKKVMFFPNRYQKTNEQKEGLSQVKRILETESTGYLLPHLSNRPAVYGVVLNGSSNNFFSQHSDKTVIEESNELMKFLMNKLMELK